jgi:hypothetical protein
MEGEDGRGFEGGGGCDEGDSAQQVATIHERLGLNPGDIEVYESLWKQVLPVGTSCLGPEAAVMFFKKSKLPNKTLRAIWEESDTEEPLGTLSKEEFFVACKLIALRQAKVEPVQANLAQPTPLPNFKAAEEAAARAAAKAAHAAPTATTSSPAPLPSLPPLPSTPTSTAKKPSLHDGLVGLGITAGAGAVPASPTGKASEESSMDHYGDLVPRKMVDVLLTKTSPTDKLCFTIAGGADCPDATKKFIYIVNFKGVPQLRKGDILSQVNGVNVEKATLQVAQDMLNNSIGAVELVLARKQKRVARVSESAQMAVRTLWGGCSRLPSHLQFIQQRVKEFMASAVCHRTSDGSSSALLLAFMLPLSRCDLPYRACETTHNRTCRHHARRCNPF